MSSQGKSNAKTTLVFCESLISTIKDPISNKTLVKRLKTLFAELSIIEQENPVIIRDANLKKVTQQLMNKKLTSNSDYGVKSFAALCIGEILRIFAPNAPYTDNQLLEFFKLFQTILKNVLHHTNQSLYFNENVNFLQRLAEVRSIILITDLPNSNDLIENLFEICYSSPSSQMAANNDSLILTTIAEILSSIISEINVISQDLLKLILNQFFYSDNPKRANSRFFSMAICSNNPERMARQISQFVSETLFENSKNITVNKTKRRKRNNQNQHNLDITDDDDDSAEDSDNQHEINKPLSEVQLRNLTKIHKLILEIWKKFPDLLSASLGFINSELFHENENIRVLAISLICKLIEFSNFENNGSNFIKFYNGYYGNLINKAILDISSNVRLCWIENIINLLTSENENTHYNLENKNILVNGIIKCLLDTNEKIRLTTIQLFISKKFYFKLFRTNNCAPIIKNFIILKTLKQLTREKKIDIRNESIKFLCLIFNEKIIDLLCEFINDSAALKKIVLASDVDKITDISTTEDLNLLIKWIPDHLLSLIYINSKSINQLIDTQLVEKIFYLLSQDNFDDYFIARYLTIWNNLCEKSRVAFFTINKRNRQISSGFLQLLKMVPVYYNEKVYLNINKRQIMESKLKGTIAWLVNTLPATMHDDSSASSSTCDSKFQNVNDSEFFNINYVCMVKFIRMNNKRLLNLVQKIIDPSSDLMTIRNSMKEFFNKIKTDPTMLTSYHILTEQSDNTDYQKSQDENNIFDNYHSLNSITCAQLERTFKLLFYRLSNFYYNKDNIDKLLDIYNCNNKIDATNNSIPEISGNLYSICQKEKEMIITSTYGLQEISKVYPDLFNYSHKTKLIDLITSYVSDESVKSNTNNNRNDILKTLLKLFHNFYSKMSATDDRVNDWLIPDSFIQVLIGLCLDRTKSSPLIAKYAIRILCIIDEKQLFNSQLIKNEILKAIYPLGHNGNKSLAIHIAILAEIMVLKTDLLIVKKGHLKKSVVTKDENEESHEEGHIEEDKSSIITSYIIKHILLGQAEEQDEGTLQKQAKIFIDNEELETTWKEDPLADACYCKVLSLKFLTNRIESMYSNFSLDNSNGEISSNEIVNLIMKLLVSCISNGGELTNDTPPFIQSRLRLQAGLMLLKISKIPIINKHYLTPLVFEKFSLLIQDEVAQVREITVTKLIKYINSDLISSRYSCLLFFTAFEPNKKLLEMARGCILTGFQKQLHSGDSENVVFEKLFVRLLYTIAHQQEFVELVQEAYDKNDEVSNELLFKAFGFASKIIIFYLSVILTQDNISLIYYLAGRIKQYKDATDSSKLQKEKVSSQESYNIYRVSDLACLVIQTYNAKVNHHNFNAGSKKGWIIETWPGKIQLSKDMFKSMISSTEQRDISGMMFIPDEIRKKLELFIRAETSSFLANSSTSANNNNYGVNTNLTVPGINDNGGSRIKKGNANKMQRLVKKSVGSHLKRNNTALNDKALSKPTRRSSRIQNQEAVSYVYASDEEDKIEVY